MKTVVCIKWGTRYGADYVNRLASMVRRHTTGDLRLVCFTDDATGIVPGVDVFPLPPIRIPERVQWLGWRKISLFQAPLADLAGEVLFLDLDMIVTGSLDPFFEFSPGNFCIAENWSQVGEGIGNTSIYRWRIGEHVHVYEDFVRDPDPLIDRFRISQKYISAAIPGKVYWPREWAVSFKHDLVPRWPLNFLLTPKLPADARVVAFTGKPDPDEALVGQWPVKAAWKKLYKHVRATPWIGEHWR